MLMIAILLKCHIGFWLFHCHVELHSDGGMTMVFQVGELWDMEPNPRHFPRCGNFIPPLRSYFADDNLKYSGEWSDEDHDIIIFNEISPKESDER